MPRSIARFSLLFVSMLSVASADPLDGVMARIDASGKTFNALSADVSLTRHESLINEDTTQPGSIRVLRSGGQTRVLLDLKEPGAIVVSLDGKVARQYHAKLKLVDEYDMTGHQGIVDQYLLLGFGATSNEIKTSYDVTYVGDEKLGARQTSHIRLVPKSAEIRRQLKLADLWIGDNGLPAQQKFTESSGDYRQVTYTNEKQGSLSEKDLQMKLPGGVKIQRNQK